MVAALVSCGNKGGDNGGSGDSGSGADGSGGNGVTEAPKETDEFGQEKFTSAIDVDSMDFEGKKLTVLHRGS